MKAWKICKIFICAFLTSNVLAASGFLPVANIIKIKGEVKINKEIAQVGSEITEGMNIKIKDPRDYVDIKYQNGHIVRLMGATIIIKELNPKSSLISLVKGTIFNLVKSLTPEEKFVVRTRRASFGVRGTQFFISESASESYLCVCDGIVKATNVLTNKALDVNKDHDLTISKNKKFEVTPASNMMIKTGNDVFNELSKTKETK